MVIKFVIDVDKLSRYCELRILCCRDYVTKFAPSNATFEHLVANKTYFKEKFTQFLFSPKGGIYQVWTTHNDPNHKRFKLFIFSRTFGFHPNWFVENPPLMFFSKRSPSNTSASLGEYSWSLFLSFFVFVSLFLFVFCVVSVLLFVQHKHSFRWIFLVLYVSYQKVAKPLWKENKEAALTKKF